MAPTAKRVALVATLPTLLAMAAVALATLERVSVDPAVSAGWAGSSTIPVWYVPLAIFATAHSFALLLTGPRPAIAPMLAGIMVLAGAVAVHVVGLPFALAEIAYWTAVTIAVFVPPLLIALPVVLMLAVAAAGALYGLLIHAPLAAARRVANSGGGRAASWKTFAAGGAVVAFICVAAFGLPSEAGRAARGGYSLGSTNVNAAWFAMAPIIAVCCAVVAMCGAWQRSDSAISLASPWLVGFLLPMGTLVAVGGPVLGAIDAPAVLRAVDTLPILSSAARHFRDGRPRAEQPIRFAGGTLALDRGLVRYQLADNPQRRITTVALRPPPVLEGIGVVDRIILNAWRAEPHRKEAEYRRTVCAASGSRPVVECRLPATGNVVLEIDQQREEYGLERRALGPDPGCRIIITGVAGRSFGIRADFDCAKTDDWPRRAAEIERYFADAHIVK